MPLYDCMLLFKPHIRREAVIDLVARVGKHVYRGNGVVTDFKSFGTVQLGYGIKKLDGRYYQGQLAQLSMMATPNINKELHYLNKEDRLLRWLLVKQRDTKYGLEFLSEENDRFEQNDRFEPSKWTQSTIFVRESEGGFVEEEDDDEEYEVNEEENKVN